MKLLNWFFNRIEPSTLDESILREIDRGRLIAIQKAPPRKETSKPGRYYVDSLVVMDTLHEWRVRLAQRGAFKDSKALHEAAIRRHNHVVVDVAMGVA